MKRNQVQHLQIHFIPTQDGKSVAERTNRFHLQLIERRLSQLPLANDQKIELVERIIEKLALDEQSADGRQIPGHHPVRDESV